MNIRGKSKEHFPCITDKPPSQYRYRMIEVYLLHNFIYYIFILENYLKYLKIRCNHRPHLSSVLHFLIYHIANNNIALIDTFYIIPHFSQNRKKNLLRFAKIYYTLLIWLLLCTYREKFLKMI